MSASGYKRTYSGQLANDRFTPNSGHCQRKMALVPESGHWMSALPPKADISVVSGQPIGTDHRKNGPPFGLHALAV